VLAVDGDDDDYYEQQAEDLTYIDTSVFLAYLLGKANDPKQYPLAKDFFIALANSKENQGARKKQGIISILVLIEIIAALRGQKTKEFELLRSITSETERTEYVIREAKIIFEKIIIEALQIPQIQYMRPLNIDVNNLLYSAFTTLYNIRGSIKFLNRCRQCGTKRPYKFLAVHKIVGSIDIIHVLLAKELKCNEFVTLDRSFEELKMYMRPLKIKILRS
jgi:predicted nucleic acid-binding protein